MIITIMTNEVITSIYDLGLLHLSTKSYKGLEPMETVNMSTKGGRA